MTHYIDDNYESKPHRSSTYESKPLLSPAEQSQIKKRNIIKDLNEQLTTLRSRQPKCNGSDMYDQKILVIEAALAVANGKKKLDYLNTTKEQNPKYNSGIFYSRTANLASQVENLFSVRIK
jgi:hypothetical protein